jgi:hypothetical protein
MKHLALLAGLLVATCSYANGFYDEPTCYSWNGGHKSSGSFSKCNAELHAWVKPHVPPPVPVAQSAPVAAPTVHQSPIMMPQSHPKPIPLKPKHKPKPKPYHHPKKGC